MVRALQPGSSGSPISVITNSFAVTTIPAQTFTHYDVEFPSFTSFPKRPRALEVIERLQLQEPRVFNPRAAYDGQRNMFRSVPLDLPNNAAVFTVFMGDPPHTNAKGEEVRITKVAEIDPRSIRDVLDGKREHNSQSLTTMTLFNVLIRMQPIMTYPSNGRSFFTQDIRENLGNGLELWRGLFQSVRPTLGRLLINIDISTAVMYNSGQLIDLLLSFIGCRDARDLAPNRLNNVMERKINSFLKNLLVTATVPPRPGKSPRFRKIEKIVMQGADQFEFMNDRTGEQISITKHYLKAHNYKVQLGHIICAKIHRGGVCPIEILKVKAGQMYKKNLPPALAPRALKFSTQKPHERIHAIQAGTKLFGYSDSDYLRHSGMTIDTRLISVKGRVLAPPPIQWGGNQKPEPPRDGAWNVVHKKFFKPAAVRAWSVVVYDNRIDRYAIERFVKMLVDACMKLGMRFPNRPPPFINGKPQGGEDSHYSDLEEAGTAAVQHFQDEFEQNRSPRPTFILVILPDSALDIRTSVKSWGDCHRGVPTQCIKRDKFLKANDQYCNNLALKINTKIGGVNSVASDAGDPQKNPMFSSMKWLSSQPTMVIGADVSHAAPGSDRPSVTALVSSVDEYFSRYVAACEVQTARQEIIQDLPDMLEHLVKSFYTYWKGIAPQRIIFFRDGVSEGQFNAVGNQEVNTIKASLADIWRARDLEGAPPKLTFIVVAKKHHVRFFPQNRGDGDRSGNCPAGLVIDQEIISPVDYDYYLQSHRGLLGTSRPSHYTVIEDENGLDANKLQEISYALCHVYARATCSVSIPAPVYYADIVCARGRFHSKLIRDEGDYATTVSGEISLQEHKRAFKKLADNMQTTMYFM